MAAPDDMAAPLPQPPPPAPARREAAIEAALRRFDDADAPPAYSRLRGERTTPWWTKLTRPQVGALISFVIVAAIGVPLAWDSFNQRPDSRPVSAPDSRVPSDSLTRKRVQSAPSSPAAEPPKSLAPPDAAARETADSRTVQSKTAAPAPVEVQELARADAEQAAKPAPGAARDNEMAVTTGQRRAEAPQGAPASVGALAEEPRRKGAERESDSKDESITVTSAFRSGAKAAARGDWNACTVNDPDRNVGRCRNREARGAAAAHLADGLSHAWSGNFAAAIAAFDQAVARSPRYALAYLNRGLAYQRNGDLDRALADFNQAVRYDPGSARNYYVRSRLLRQQGNERRAQADERRAVEIDPGYADLLS